MTPGSAPNGPIFQYAAVRRCNALRKEIEAGSGFAVLAAIRICGTHGLVMPDWLVFAFNRRYDAVLNLRALSWDDDAAFGRPYRKNTNRAALQKRRVWRPQIWNDVANAVEAGKSLESAFSEIGGRIGRDPKEVEKMYREALRIYGLFNPVEEQKRQKTREEETAQRLFAMAAVARENSRDSIELAPGVRAAYLNDGPMRESAIKKTAKSQPSILKKVDGRRRREK